MSLTTSLLFHLKTATWSLKFCTEKEGKKKERERENERKKERKKGKRASICLRNSHCTLFNSFEIPFVILYLLFLCDIYLPHYKPKEGEEFYLFYLLLYL